MSSREQLHQGQIWYVVQTQKSTCYNPLCILISDKSIQLVLHIIPVMYKHVSSQVVDQPINYVSTKSLSARKEDGLHVSMVGLNCSIVS